MENYNDFVAVRQAQGVSNLEIAAQWWDYLADCDENPNCIRTYRRTAESLRIQERIGVAVCVCCHKPFGDHK